MGRTAVKGVQVRIREGGSGNELSVVIATISIGANMLNKLAKETGPNMKAIARKLTKGRLVIIGDKGRRSKKVSPLKRPRT